MATVLRVLLDDLGNPNILPGATSVSNIATAGLRSGDYANTRNSIDSIINNPSRSSQATNVAPGILSITGLFDNGQAQMIMRGLSQKKGADVMTAPSILAKSGESATIEVIREFIYPTEYEPPELPQSVGTTGTTSMMEAEVEVPRKFSLLRQQRLLDLKHATPVLLSRLSQRLVKTTTRSTCDLPLN